MRTRLVTLLSINQTKYIKKIALTASVIWGLAVSLGWSESTVQSAQNSLSSQQPTISADATQNQIHSSSQLGSANQQIPQDFLSSSAPLSAPTPQAQSLPESHSVSVVAVSNGEQQCTHTGSAEGGSESCLSKTAGNHFIESNSAWESWGDESKKQSVVKYYDSDANPAGENTTRIKTIYHTDDLGKKFKEQEFYDIVDMPAKGLIKRDLVVKSYDASGNLTKVTWAHYKEIGFKKAGLETHVVLYYENSKLNSGYANRYRSGKVITTQLYYDPKINADSKIKLSGMNKWIKQIDHLIQSTASASN